MIQSLCLGVFFHDGLINFQLSVILGVPGIFGEIKSKIRN